MPHITPKLRDIKAVIFDWSGVISDDRRPVYQANLKLMKDHDMEAEPFEQWVANSKSSAHEYFLSRGVKRSKEYLAQAYQQALRLVRKDGTHPTIYQDVVTVLKKLKKDHKALFVVSKHPKDHLLNEAREFGIDNFFDEIIGSVNDKSKVMQKIVLRQAWQPSDVIMIGDTIYDIKSAKQVGIFSIGVTTGYHTLNQLESIKPDVIIASLSELLNYV